MAVSLRSTLPPPANHSARCRWLSNCSERDCDRPGLPQSARGRTRWNPFSQPVNQATPHPLCQYVHACEKLAIAPQDDRSWPHPNPLARQGESIKTGIGDQREEMDFNYSEEAEVFRHELRA